MLIVTSDSGVFFAIYHALPTDQKSENDNKSSCGEVRVGVHAYSPHSLH